MTAKKIGFNFNIVAWICLLAIVAYSVFQTAQTNERLEEAQSSMRRSSDCTEQFLGATVLALNERTTYSTENAKANVTLQEAQVRFLTLLSTPRGADPAAFDEALETYLGAQRSYAEIIALSSGQARKYAYPTVEEYRLCLDGSVDPTDLPPQPPLSTENGD